MKPGEELELVVERLAAKGRSSTRLDGRDIHVAGAIPGDRVRAVVLKRRGRNVEARTIEVLESSPLRAEPRCSFFGECGGCRWQNLLYASQLDMKREMILDAFHESRVFDTIELPPVMAAEEIYHYRNKMEFSFGSRRWLTPAEVESGDDFDREFALGMYAPGRYDRILDLTECHLPPTIASEIVNSIRDLAKGEGWLPWNTSENNGFLRHLVIRTPEHSDEVLVNLVTNGFERERMELVATMLKEQFPRVITFLNTINTGVAQVSFGETTYTIFGDGIVHDKIGNLTYEIGAHSFFQTNTRQAERLYEVARDLAEFHPDDVVFDLFSGIGAITLFVAPDVRYAFGLELDKAAVESARRSAQLNQIENVEFLVADLGKSFADSDWPISVDRPDVVILDPPRAGIHPKVAHWLRDAKPDRIVYVSCNPVTQARDIALLRGYSVTAVQPVDLFPHTDHIENVALLHRDRR